MAPHQSVHKKVIDRTLALYQHGPPPNAGTADKWPPPPVQNPWDETFVPKEFPTTHKIPSTMPKRWDLHASSPLMLRPPQSYRGAGSTGLRDIQEFFLAGSFRSQGCPYLYDVRYFNGRRLQFPTEGPPLHTWFYLKEQYSQWHFTCGWSHPKSQFYGSRGSYNGSWFWSHRHGTVYTSTYAPSPLCLGLPYCCSSTTW